MSAPLSPNDIIPLFVFVLIEIYFAVICLTIRIRCCGVGGSHRQESVNVLAVDERIPLSIQFKYFILICLAIKSRFELIRLFAGASCWAMKIDDDCQLRKV